MHYEPNPNVYRSMFSLVYASHASFNFSETQLSDLVVLASAKNRDLAITGFLQYKERRFFQYLEGDKDTVLALKDTICSDSRHTVLRVVDLPDIESRRFEDWHMRHATYSRFAAADLINLLENTLLGMGNLTLRDEYVNKRATRLVNLLAEHHRKFPEFS